MNGDIAHRSIRSSMSWMVDARLPRMISSVTGSTGAGLPTGVAVLAIGALQEDVVGVVDAGSEARRDERGRVVLIDDRRALESHAGSQTRPAVHGDAGGAGTAEIDPALA